MRGFMPLALLLLLAGCVGTTYDHPLLGWIILSIGVLLVAVLIGHAVISERRDQ